MRPPISCVVNANPRLTTVLRASSPRASYAASHEDVPEAGAAVLARGGGRDEDQEREDGAGGGMHGR